jgi:hydrogenase/urease accessory protein HupE
MKKILIATATLVSTAGVAMAHPGDHEFSFLSSVAHILSEPDHLAMIAVAVIVVGVLFYKRSRRSV